MCTHLKCSLSQTIFLRNRHKHPITFKQIKKIQVTSLMLSTIHYHATIGQESKRTKTKERCFPI